MFRTSIKYKTRYKTVVNGEEVVIKISLGKLHKFVKYVNILTH